MIIADKIPSRFNPQSTVLTLNPLLPETAGGNCNVKLAWAEVRPLEVRLPKRDRTLD